MTFFVILLIPLCSLMLCWTQAASLLRTGTSPRVVVISLLAWALVSLVAAHTFFSWMTW